MKPFVALAGIIAVLVIASSATGAKPAANWSVKPTKLSFGNEVAQTQSAPMTVTVTNTSAVTEQVAGAHQMSGDVADFNVQGSSSCLFPAPPVSVAPGASCVVQIVFNPQSVGTFKATIQIDLNPGPAVLITVTGRGT